MPSCCWLHRLPILKMWLHRRHSPTPMTGHWFRHRHHRAPTVRSTSIRVYQAMIRCPLCLAVASPRSHGRTSRKLLKAPRRQLEHLPLTPGTSHYNISCAHLRGLPRPGCGHSSQPITTRHRPPAITPVGQIIQATETCHLRVITAHRTRSRQMKSHHPRSTIP